MLIPIGNPGVLASHTMPDLLTPLLVLALIWNMVPIFVGAALGAGISWPIRWRPLGGTAVGFVIGMGSSIPLLLLALIVTSRLMGGLPLLLCAGVVACFASSSVAYAVARIGRTRVPLMTLHELIQNCNEIDRILREKLAEIGISVESSKEMDVAVQNAGLLSFDQLGLWVEIRKRKNAFKRSRVVVHDDVALWAAKSMKLLQQILSDSNAHSPLTHASGDPANPYLPPGHRNPSHRP